MPSIVIGGVLAGLGSGFGSWLAGEAFAFSWAAFTTTVVLGGISTALSQKSDQPALTNQGPLVTIRQPISYWQVIFGRRRVGGVLTFRYINPDWAFWHMVITLACHECESVDEIYFNDELVWTPGGGVISKYASNVRIQISLGGAAEGQPFPDLVSESSGRWSNDHKQHGHTKIYVRLWADQDLFPSGVPNVTATVKGVNQVYDDRDASTGYSNNITALLAHYLTNAEYGFGADFADEIDADDFAASANICDESVALAGGGSEPRYTANGAFTLNEKPADIITRLNAACAGKAVYIGDKWHLLAGGYTAPTVTLDEDDLTGGLSIQPQLDDRDSCNGVKGIFTSPNAHWQPTDFPALRSSTYVSEDGGEEQWKNVDYSAFVTSVTQSQRLSKIELLSIRQGLSATAPFKMPAFAVIPGKTVALNLAKFGFSSKVFEVVESGLSVIDGEDGQLLQVPLVLRETAAAIFDWSTSEEQPESIAPNTTLPDPTVIDPPGAPSVSETLYETRDSRGPASKLTVSWTASSYPFAPHYQLEYRVTGAVEWNVMPLTRGLSVEIFDVAPDYYDFRVKAVTLTGTSSGYVETLAVEVFGLGAPPSAPSGVSLQIAGGLAVITLDLATDLDVLMGGRILVRHTASLTGQTWEEAFSIGQQESWPGSSVLIVLPLKPGSYLLKSVDSSHQESDTFAVATTKQASVLNFSSLTSVVEEPLFSGSKTNVVLNSGAIELDVDGSGNVLSSGVYVFASGIDFGTVTRARLTTLLQGIVFAQSDLIDSRTANIDTWANFDGDVGIGSAGDAWIESRETDDDPSGTPTWSEWKRIDAGEFDCRGLQFRVQMRSFDPAYNVSIDTCEVNAEEVI